MKLKVLIVLCLCILFLFLPPAALADDEFDIAVNSTFDVGDNGIAKISQTIAITNKAEFIYTPSYAITLGLKDIRELETFNDQGSVPSTLGEGESGKIIEITFPTKNVGLGRVNKFTVSFETADIAKNKGSIWEVNIPGLSSPDDFSSYNITLNVPKSFGVPSITKPQKALIESPYYFSKNDLGESGILVIFGESQFYDLTLTYSIANSKILPVKTEIALPAQTSYQDVRINELAPSPSDVYQDDDGNWLAVYNLFPGQTKIIKAKVAVRVYGKPVFERGRDTKFLSTLKYWEVQDPEINRLGKELKTPKAIYDYVVTSLSYNFDKVAEENVRLGAKEALRRKDFAVCLEFTDLFIALARAAGISAREVEGYAYTENSKLRPLSLVKDVLHSWPEYFDENIKTWVMVDPTWGNTTHGTDYFTSFDFEHIAFVVKGKDSTYPIPAGGYKINQDSKDVSVIFGSSSGFTDILKSEVTAIFPSHVLSGLAISGVVKIRNTGNMPIENKRVTVKSPLIPGSWDYTVEKIPPYGEKLIPLEFKNPLFLTSRDYEVTILFDGNTVTKRIRVGLFPDYFLILIGGVVSFGSIIVAVAAYKTWNIYIQRRKKQSDLRGEGKRPS